MILKDGDPETGVIVSPVEVQESSSLRRGVQGTQELTIGTSPGYLEAGAARGAGEKNETNLERFTQATIKFMSDWSNSIGAVVGLTYFALSEYYARDDAKRELLSPKALALGAGVVLIALNADRRINQIEDKILSRG